MQQPGPHLKTLTTYDFVQANINNMLKHIYSLIYNMWYCDINLAGLALIPFIKAMINGLLLGMRRKK